MLKNSIIVCLLLSSYYADAQSGFQEDFEIFKKALTETHPNLYRFSSRDQFDKTFDSIQHQVEQGTTHLEFFRMLSEVEALIREGHSGVLPSKVILDNLSNAALLPFNVWVTDSLLVITGCEKSDDNHLIGNEILSINGLSIPSLLEKMEKATGYKSALSNAALKTILSYENNFAMAYYLFLDSDKEFVIKFRDDENDIEKQATIMGSHATIERKFPLFPPENDPPYSLTIDEPNKTAILTVTTFAYWVVGKRVRDYLKYFESVFKELAEKNVEKLIIDVRTNRGGEEIIAAELLTYFTAEDFKIYKYLKAKTLDFDFTNKLPNAATLRFSKKDYNETDSGYYLQDNEVLKTFTPKEKIGFSGEVFILSSGGSRSATSIFLSLIKSQHSGTIIGTESGGAFEDVDGRWRVSFTLPYSGIGVTYPAWTMKLKVSGGDTRRGVIPDIILRKSKKDVLGLSDSQLEYVLQLGN